VGGRRSARAAPLKESHSRRCDLLVNVRCAIIGSAFIYRLAAEAEYPSFDAPLRDQMGDPLTAHQRSPIMELLPTLSNTAVIGIDCHN
jgi:hypothetical protein